MPANTRPALVVIALVTLGLAAAAHWGFESAVMAGVSLRTSFLLGALWLAWPEITQKSIRNVLIIAIGLVMLFLRPRTAWVVVPALLLWAGMRER